MAKSAYQRIKEKKGNSGSSNTISSKLNNYKTRLENLGIEKDTRNPIEKALNLTEGQNWLFDIFELIGRPQQALFGGIESLQQGEDFFEGMKEGLSGEKVTTGGELLRNAGMGGSGEFNLFQPDTYDEFSLSDVLGFTLDLFADPVDLALVPLTMGTNLAVSAGVKGAKGAIKVADTAGDIAKTAKLVKNTGKSVGTTADVAKAVTGLKDAADIATTITRRVSPLTYATNKAGKAVKGVARIADSGVERALRSLDTRSLNKLDNLSSKTGKILDTSKAGANLLDDYRYIKKSIGNFIDSSKALPNNLVEKIRRTKGAGEFVRTQSQKLLIDIYTKIDDYALDVLKKSGTNVDEAVSFLSKNKNATLSDFIVNTKNDDLARAISTTRDNVADDVFNYAESFMSTDVNGSNFINGLTSRNGNKVITLTNDSANALQKLLNDNGVVTRLSQNPDGLGVDVRVMTKDKNILNYLRNDDNFLEQLNGLNLQRSLGYNADDIKYLDALRANPEFVTMADEARKSYDSLNTILRDVFNVDMGEIVNRPGYARRAKSLQSSFDTDFTGKGPVNTKAFSGRKYTRPALVENRIAKNRAERQIKTLNKSIKREVSQLSNVKEYRLKNTITDLTGKRSTVENLYNKRISKASDAVKRADENISRNLDLINKQKLNISDELIDKVSTIPDNTTSKTLIRNSARLDEKMKELNSLTNYVNKNIAKMSDADFEKYMKNIDNVSQDVASLQTKVNISSAKVRGSVDDLTLRTIDRTNTTIDNTNELSKKVQKNITKKEEYINKEQLLKDTKDSTINSINERLKYAESQLLNNVNPANNRKVFKEIEKLQRAKEVIRSKEGQQLLNTNFLEGVQNFIDYSTKNAEGAKILNDALITGTFSDKRVFQTSVDLVDGKIPRGFVEIPTSKLKAQLETMNKLLPTDSDTLDVLLDGLGDKVYMDKYLADALSFSTRQQMHPIVKLINSFNNTFKKYKILTPGFQLRNITGNASNLILSGVPAHKIPGLYRDVGKFFTGTYTDDLLKKARNGIASLTTEELADYKLLQQFAEGGFLGGGSKLQDLTEIGSINKVVKNPLDKAVSFNAFLNESMDGINRMALLKYANDNPKFLRNLGLRDPITAVKRILMDPANMSNFERDIVKKIIPFYTFTKQNLIFQGTNIMKNTSKYNKLFKAVNAAYNSLGENEYNQYQKEGFQIPTPWVDDNGNRMFLKTNLPVSDLGEFLANPLNRTLSSTSPLIKAPIELATGKDLYTGQDLYKPMIEQIASYIGIDTISTNLWNKIQAILDEDKDPQEKVAEIFRSLVQNVNEERLTNSKEYQELLEYQALVSQLKEQGIEVPTVRELTAANKVTVNRIKNRRKKNRSN